MNIGIFTNNYLPNPYGVPGSIESFRKQFEKHGHAVYIFAPKYKSYRDKNPNIFRYPSINLYYKIKFPIVIPYSLKMDRIIDNLKLDIIHSQHPVLLGIAAKKWSEKKNIPLAFTWHTLYDKYAHFFPLLPEKTSGAYMIRKAVNYANESDCIVAPTNSVKEIVKGWGVTNENIEVIPTGVEEAKYQNPDRNKMRKKYDIKDNEVLLLLISRLTQEKNVEFLFNSVVRILKNTGNTKFLVSGDGNLLPKLKWLAVENNLQHKIVFEGIIPEEDIKNYYVAGDIFVYASKSETQGMIISEAMYCGLPIVAVDATGVSDLVQNDINGFLVSESENNFASAVEKLIKDGDLRRKFSEASRKIARENFTDRICAEKMLKVYEKLIKN